MKVKAAGGESGSDSAPPLMAASSRTTSPTTELRPSQTGFWTTGLKRPPAEQVSDQQVSAGPATPALIWTGRFIKPVKSSDSGEPVSLFL